MTPEARRRLEDLLNREITAAHSLTTALAAERSALTGNSPAAVLQNAADKVGLLTEIEALEIERRGLWGTAGLDGTGIGALVAERWRALLQLMAGCRTANDVNGYIINIRQNQIRQLVDIVRGGAPVTYGPQGKTFSRTPRALARA
jgi:flagellar biosynthesis/type III secretory pathway chaperone